MNYFSKYSFIISFAFVACRKEATISVPDNYIESGSALIVNEGGFQRNNGSISYITRSNKVYNNVFEQANSGQIVGDILQSFTRSDNYGIICANNSQKVIVVDARTFKQVANITNGTDYPRFALGVAADKVYITNGSGAGNVLVLNLKTFAIDKSIPVGDGPEEMLALNGKVYVANSGGFGNDNTLSVIDVSTDREINRITVGDYPTEIEKDAEGYLWILCKGALIYPPPSYAPVRQTPAKLVRINPATGVVDKSIELVPATADLSAADNLAMSGDGSRILVCVDDKVYSMPITATSLPSTPFINRLFYGLDIHPFTNEIWGVDPGDFNQAGKVIRYNANAAPIDSFKVGIIPSSVYFNF
jgi:YVTN family beta-propeller protein